MKQKNRIQNSQNLDGGIDLIFLGCQGVTEKVGNALSVDGTTDSITHNDKTLNSVIEEIRTTEAESTSNLT